MGRGGNPPTPSCCVGAPRHGSADWRGGMVHPLSAAKLALAQAMHRPAHKGAKWA